MPTIERRGPRWYIRFYSRRREPHEKKVAFPVEAYSRAQIERKKAELVHKWYEGEYDPWTDGHPARALSGSLENSVLGASSGGASSGGASSGRASSNDERNFSVGAAVERYCQVKREAGERGERGGWSEKTYRGTAPNLRAFAEHVGVGRALASITTADVQRYMYHREVRPRTRNTYRGFVRAFLNWCVAAGLLERTPELPPPVAVVRDVPLYATRRELRAICRAHLDRHEEHQARAHVRARPNRYHITEIFRFAFFQGWRRQELVALRRRHIDYRAMTLTLRSSDAPSKSNRFSEVPLTTPGRDVLAALTPGLAPSDYVFDYRYEEGLSRAFKAASDVAVPSKPRLHLHSLRHSAGAFWRKAGMGREQIQDLLGHADSTSTAIYDSIQPGQLARQFAGAYEALREEAETSANPLFS